LGLLPFAAGPVQPERRSSLDSQGSSRR
jgi:hypothetical protein